MADCIVTGCAGFIGSNLSERLISLKHNVIGIDCFTPYYSRSIKQHNLKSLISSSKFHLIDKDIGKFTSRDIPDNIDIVFHLSAQPGVRLSWGTSFNEYIYNNIFVTQHLLEIFKKYSKLKKIIYASSSSIYGDALKLPVNESALPCPVSPYGVTKLAGENLCFTYYKNYGIPVVILRYFTVYGPGQRPDMAIHKFINAIFNNEEIIIYGSGEQTRDFTYVEDIVNANILAMEKKCDGEIVNIGGGTRIKIEGLLEILREVTGKKIKVKYTSTQKGDVKNTYADISKAKKILSYNPKVPIKEGIKAQIEWMKHFYQKKNGIF